MRKRFTKRSLQGFVRVTRKFLNIRINTRRVKGIWWRLQSLNLALLTIRRWYGRCLKPAIALGATGILRGLSIISGTWHDCPGCQALMRQYLYGRFARCLESSSVPPNAQLWSDVWGIALKPGDAGLPESCAACDEQDVLCLC